MATTLFTNMLAARLPQLALAARNTAADASSIVDILTWTNQCAGSCKFVHRERGVISQMTQ